MAAGRPPSIRARPSPAARQRHQEALSRWQQAHGADVDGLQSSMERATSALQATLYGANVDAYTNQLNRFARTVGHSPAATRNTLVPAAAARLRQQAAESATSIVHTQVERGMALQDVYADDPAGAAEAFDVWNEAQQRLISQYEAGRAAAQAMRDVIAYNPGLVARARVAPPETDQDDECLTAIEAGEIDASEIAVDLPLHPRCPHYWSYNFGTVDDPQSLWVGAGPEAD